MQAEKNDRKLMKQNIEIIAHKHRLIQWITQ